MSNGEYRGRYPHIDRVVKRAALEQLREPIELYNGTVFLIDWPRFRSPTNEGVALTIPVRYLDYFTMVLAHEGLHPVIQSHANQQLELDQSAEIQSVAEFRERLSLFEDPSNPLQRPTALGMSVNLYANSSGGWRMLAVRRSDGVALNPGTFTTAIDEGVHVLDGHFPWTILGPAIDDEIGVGRIDPAILRTDLECVGFHAPEPDDLGIRAGGNILYFLRIPSVQMLAEFAETALSSHETSEAFVLDPADILSRFPCESVSPALRICAELMARRAEEGT